MNDYVREALALRIQSLEQDIQWHKADLAHLEEARRKKREQIAVREAERDALRDFLDRGGA